MGYVIENRLIEMVAYSPVQGEFRIRLDANESPFALRKEITDRFKREIEKINYNRYPDPFSWELCSKYAHSKNLNVNCVVAGNGSDELINLIMQTFLKDGEKILGLSLDFSMYKFYSHLKRAKFFTIDNPPNKPLSTDLLISEIKREKPKMLIFSNPCNPTGQILSKEETLKVCRACLPETLVIIDEAYMDFSNQSIINEVEYLSNVIVLRTMSKAFSAAGIRLGFAITNTDLAKILRKTKAPYNVNIVTQRLGSILLDYYVEFEEQVNKILKIRDKLYLGLMSYQHILTPFSSNANFILMKTSKAKVLYETLRNEGILIRYFGNDLLRITAGSEEEQQQLFSALDKIIEQL